MPEDLPSEPAVSEAEPDYSTETDEELEARLARGEGMVEQDTPAPQPPPQEETPPEVEEQEPGIEPDIQEPAEQAEEPPAEQTPTETEQLRQELDLREQRFENERKRMEFLLGRQSGAKGHLEKRVNQLEDLLARATRPQSDDDYAEPASQQPQQVPTGDQSRLAELEADSRQQALIQAYSQFMEDTGVARLSEEEQQKLRAELAPAAERYWEPYKDMELNVTSLRKVTRMVLDSAFTDYKLSAMQREREEARTKKVSQVSDRKKSKQAATVSGSGASPSPKPQSKSTADMTAEEADAEMIRLYGDGHSRRRR